MVAQFVLCWQSPPALLVLAGHGLHVVVSWRIVYPPSSLGLRPAQYVCLGHVSAIPQVCTCLQPWELASCLHGAMLAALRGSEWKIKEMRCSWPIRLKSCRMFTVNVCLRVASCVVCTCLVWCPLHRHLTWTAPTNYRSTESTTKLYYFIYWRHPCVCVCERERGRGQGRESIRH